VFSRSIAYNANQLSGMTRVKYPTVDTELFSIYSSSRYSTVTENFWRNLVVWFENQPLIIAGTNKKFVD